MLFEHLRENREATDKDVRPVQSSFGILWELLASRTAYKDDEHGGLEAKEVLKTRSEPGIYWNPIAGGGRTRR